MTTEEKGERSRRAAFFVCSVAAVLTVFLHRHHPGVDLPQHANLLQIWANFHGSPTDYPQFYRLHLGTPYVLAYALALPFAKIFGATFGIKVVIAVAAVATPWTMMRWLRIVGGAQEWGFLGFFLAFGFAYLWGFISHLLAIPLLFSYLTAFEEQGHAPSRTAVLRTAAWALALFFCHGISFALGALCCGLRCLWPFRVRTLLERGAHIIPAVAAASAWFTSHHQTDMPGWADFTPLQARVVTFFSGVLWPSGKEDVALVVVAVLAGLVVASGVKPRWDPRAAVPFCVSIAGFLLLPQWVGGTWLVGMRFCAYAHVFLWGSLGVRSGAKRKTWFPWIVVLTTLAALGYHNVRLAAFDRELEGLDVIAKAIPKGGDVRTIVCDGNGDSAVFGFMQLCQTPAWIVAEQGGLMENDYGRYNQLPVLRRSGQPYPTRFRYWVGHGDRRQTVYSARRFAGDDTFRVLRESDRWVLLEEPPQTTADGALEIVRSAQGWGKLMIDRSISEKALSVGGAEFRRGLGTHAASYIVLRPTRLLQSISGACGVDDGAENAPPGTFRIRTVDGKVLFDSGIVRPGEAARRFEFAVSPGDTLVFEANAVGTSWSNAHLDWVDLEVR